MIKRVLPVLLVLLLSCSGTTVPSGVMAPEALCPVVKDIMLTDEYISNSLLKDSSLNIKKKRSELYEEVFALHKTTRKDFYASFKYYQEHPDLQKILFDSLSESLKRREVNNKVPVTIDK